MKESQGNETEIRKLKGSEREWLRKSNIFKWTEITFKMIINFSEIKGDLHFYTERSPVCLGELI